MPILEKKGTGVHIRGEYWLPAAPAQLWIMLADREIWTRCLDRCVTLQRISPHDFAIGLAAENGTLKGEIESRGKLTIVAPGSRVELAGTARGAAIGSLEWRAEATMEGESGGSTLRYSLVGETGGGTEVADWATMEKLARASIDRFLGALSRECIASHGHPKLEPSEANRTPPAGPPKGAGGGWPRYFRGARLWPWIAVLILIALRLLAFFQSPG